ncbi:MAG TPA: sugar ABC transporter permease [Symbiobacteriaceae bacterium]|nr:sugar ABC transporter permease [Symbiobacteriaceae bacterium]
MRPLTILAPSRLLRRPLSLQQVDQLWGYLFVAPQLAGFLLFVIGPVVAVFLFSMQQKNLLAGTTMFVGLKNFEQMLADPMFTKVLVNSGLFTLGLVPLNLVLALTLAFLLTRNLRGSTFFRTVFFAPVVTSAVAWAIVWRFMLQGEQGTVNQLLGYLSVHGPNWLREPGWAMAAVIVTRVMKTVGLNMLLFMAAIQALPREVEEAAQVDGAGTAMVLRRIQLPLLAPTILMVSVITVIGSLQVFDHIMLMTEGGPDNSTMVLVYYVYYQAFRTFETGYASTLAVVLFVAALLLTLLQWSMRRRIHNEV